MPHYVCTGGCGGVSETVGACQTEGCAKHNQPLVECNCTDGQHAEALGKAGAEAPEKAPEAPADNQ